MILGLGFLYIMPESPRFLIATKQFEEARRVFTWIGKVNGLEPKVIQERLDEILFEGEDERETTFGMSIKNQSSRVSRPTESSQV